MNIIYENSITVEEYNNLREEVCWGALSEKQAKTGIDNSAYIVAAKKDGKAIGTARVISDGGYAVFIVDVMVLPEYQRQGIGKAMLQMIMTYLKNKVESGEKLFVCLMAAKGKEEFYKKFGFLERPNECMGAGMVQWIC